MNNIEKAKKLLAENDFTCVLCKDDTVYTSTLKGVAPMVKYIGEKTDLRGFSVADKVVGKAAAMLFVISGVKELYAEVITHTAKEILEKYEILVSYKTLTDHIINRTKTDLCPMEKATANINNPEEAFEAIKKKLKELS